MGGAIENLNQSSIGMDDQSTTMLTIDPKPIPISHSTPTLEPFKIHEVQAAPFRAEHHPIATKGLGKILTPEAKRIILEIKEKASQIDP